MPLAPSQSFEHARYVQAAAKPPMAHWPSIPNAALNAGRQTPPSVNMVVVPRMAQVMQSFVGFALPAIWQTPIMSHVVVGPVPVVADATVTPLVEALLTEVVVAVVTEVVVTLELVDAACPVDVVEVAPPLPWVPEEVPDAHASVELATTRTATRFEFISTSEGTAQSLSARATRPLLART